MTESLSHRSLRKLHVVWRRLTGYSEPRAQLAAEAGQFWRGVSQQDSRKAQDSHWRGHGVFADDRVWLGLGADHLLTLQRMAAPLGLAGRQDRVVEWGCGGGMNAVHFGRGASAYYGVDIAPASLDECARQMRAEGLTGFVPVLVDPECPAAGLAPIDAPCDLFVSTYVFELLPSPEDAREVLRIAHRLLTPGGLAFIQVRLSRGGWWSEASRPWDYAGNVSHNVRFTRPDFEQASRDAGFEVVAVEMQERVPQLDEKDYAFFLLRRPVSVT